MTLTTKDGTAIIAWGTYGSVRGYGPPRLTLAEAQKDRQSDERGCASQGGYSDREVVAIDERGTCWQFVEGTIGSYVRTHPGRATAAYYTAGELETLPVRTKSGVLCRVRVSVVGQNFAVIGQLISDDSDLRVVASTDELPFGMRGVAAARARELASSV